MADTLYGLDQKGVDRLRRALIKVEAGEAATLRTRRNLAQASQLKLAYPQNDVAPGTFNETTFQWFQATGSTTEPTVRVSDVIPDPTRTAYDWFRWGFDKRARAIAFRPIPSQQRYLYQPPAARWGKVVSVTTAASGSVCDSVKINPSTDPRGALADTATTLTIQLPMRSGKDPDLGVGDVIAYMPTLFGQLVAVSDYTETGAGQALWGKVVSGGVTTGAASTDFDWVKINPSTNAVGDATDSGTTYTIILPKRQGVTHNVTAGDVIAYMPSADGRYTVVSDYSAGSGQVLWGKVISPGISTGSASTNADSVLINPSTNAVGDATDTATTRTIILPRRAGKAPSLGVGDVIGYMPTADGRYSIVSDYTDAAAAAAAAPLNVLIGHYSVTTGTYFTAAGTTHLQFDTFTGSTSLAGFGLETTGAVTLKATTPTKLLLHFNWSPRVDKAGSRQANPWWQVQLQKNTSAVNEAYNIWQGDTDILHALYGNAPGWGCFVNLTSGDTLRVWQDFGGLTAGSSARIVAGTLTIIRAVEEDQERAKWGKVSANPSTAGGCDSVQINPCANSDGGSADTATTYTIKLPRRAGVEPYLTTGDVLAYDDTEDDDKVCLSDYSGDQLRPAQFGGVPTLDGLSTNTTWKEWTTADVYTTAAQHGFERTSSGTVKILRPGRYRIGIGWLSHITFSALTTPIGRTIARPEFYTGASWGDFPARSATVFAIASHMYDTLGNGSAFYEVLTTSLSSGWEIRANYWADCEPSTDSVSMSATLESHYMILQRVGP